MNKIRIEPTENPLIYRVYLDGIDVSKYINSIKFELLAGCPPEVWLRAVGHIEIPKDAWSNVVVIQESDKKE